MSDKITKSPQIRFAGFTDAWEQRELGSIANVIDPHPSHRAPVATDVGIPFIGIGDVDEVGNINQNTARIVDEKIYDEHHRRYDLSVNSIGIGRVASLGKVIRLRNDIGKYAVSPTMSIIQFNASNDLDYLYACMNTPTFQNQFKSFSNGSTRQSVGIQDLRKMMLDLPKEIEEQSKIGSFFDNIDNLITFHRRKLNNVKNLKAGLLQKMFPKNGEDFPEVRFPGFSDAWEQRKLSELLFPADERNNAGKYTQDDVLAASLGTELVKKHIFFGLRSTEESVKNYRVVNSGDVIYTKSPIKGYPNGIIRTNKGLDGIVPSLYCVYHCIPSINSSIIQIYFEDKGRLDAYLYPLVNIGARNNVNITDLGFLEGTICISKDIDEQNKIVAFFNHLTNLITLHQRELNSLKNLKKSLLQQMFI